MSDAYDACHWYWFVGIDTTQVYSSGVQAYVPVSNSTYTAWLANGNTPSTIASEPELWQVLATQCPAGISSGNAAGQAAIAGQRTFYDAYFTLRNFADGSKQIRFSAANVSSGQTRIYGGPNQDDTLVGVAATQTLSNKTLQAVDGAVATPSIAFVNEPSTGMWRPTTGQIAWSVSGIEGQRLLNDTGTPRLIFGHTASIAVQNTTGDIQLHRAANLALTLTRWDASAASPALWFGKSRGPTIGTHAAVQSGDFLTNIAAAGSDGAAFQVAVRIRFVAEGNFTSANAPARIEISTTPSGSVTPVVRANIFNDGGVIFGAGATSPGAGNVKIEATTATTTSANGALVVNGGIGVAGKILAADAIGYTIGAGAGGTVSQSGSITTGVTLNKVCGQITTVSSTLPSTASTFFTLTNSTIGPTDVVVAIVASYGGTTGTPSVFASTVGVNTCVINLQNIHPAAALNGTVTIAFAVFKASTN